MFELPNQPEHAPALLAVRELPKVVGRRKNTAKNWGSEEEKNGSCFVSSYSSLEELNSF